MARKRKPPADARLALEQVFDSIPDLERKWKTLIEAAFSAERQREISVAITCKCCGETRKYMVVVPIPDWSARTKALTELLTQAKGKPVETQRVDLAVHAARTREELERMSESQLLAIAAAPDAPSA